MADQVLRCQSCQKKYRVRSYDADRLYACRQCGDPLATTSSPGPSAQETHDTDPLIGQQVGQYRIIAKLGEGGMGTVYKVEHSVLRRVRALKILPEHLAKSSPKRVQRFLREARSAAVLSHPNIVAVHNADEVDGRYFIDMDLVDGESAQERLDREGRLSIEEATRIVLDTARALAAAHAVNIVHRDIKPANILIDGNDTVRVADFGLAKNVQTDPSLTAEGKKMLGTPYFMSPEQCDGKTVDGRTDIYALGVTYFYLLTGALPFDGDTGFAVMLKHKTEPVPNPRELRPEIGEAMSQVIMKMVAKGPEQRYQNCNELIAELSGPAQLPLESGRAAELRSASEPPRIRRPVVAAGLAIAAVLTFGVVWGIVRTLASDRETGAASDVLGTEPAGVRTLGTRAAGQRTNGRPAGEDSAALPATTKDGGAASSSTLRALLTEYVAQAQALRASGKYGAALERVDQARALLADQRKRLGPTARIDPTQEILMQQLVASIELTVGAASRANLKQIGLAIHMYQADYNKLPPKNEFPQALMPYLDGNQGLFYHPLNTAEARDAFPNNIDYQLSSALPRSIMFVRQQHQTPLVWEKEARVGRQNVLFCDGHVEEVTSATLAKMIAPAR